MEVICRFYQPQNGDRVADTKPSQGDMLERQEQITGVGMLQHHANPIVLTERRASVCRDFYQISASDRR
jgi:hypothetical protein